MRRKERNKSVFEVKRVKDKSRMNQEFVKVKKNIMILKKSQ